MRQLKFIGGDKEIQFEDKYIKGNYGKSNMRIIEYYKNGKAVYIDLNVKQVQMLYDEITKFKEEYKNKSD